MIPERERPDGAANPSSEIPRSGDRHPGAPADEPADRIQAETATRTLRERLRTLIDALPLAIVTVDRDQRVQTWNPAAERLFGWKAEEVLGESVPFVLDDRRQEFRGLLEEPQEAQQDGMEQSLVRKDGSPVNVSLWTVPRLSDTGEVTGNIALFADTSERKRAQETLATRTRHLEAVRTVSEEITRELNLPVLLRLIIQRAAELVGASSGVVYQWNENGEELVAGAWYGYEDWAGTIRRKMGDGVAGRVAQHREGLLVNDYQHWPGANPLFRDRSKLTAVLGEPLLYRDQLLGVITLDDQKTRRPFSPQDQETLRLFAAQAAIAIGNARLFQQEQERSNQLDTVRAVSAEVTRELDLSRLLRLITERSVELLGGGSGAVVLWNEAAQVLVPAAWHGHEDWYGATSWRLGEGVIGTVAKRREGLVVNDYRNSPHAHPLFLLRTEITATLAEPLLYHDRILGVVTVDGYGEGRAFTDRDRRLLSLFASQAAIAIENARLYAASEQRAVELETLRGIEQAITSRLELPAVLEEVVAGAMRILDNPFAQIILWDAVSQSLRFGAARGPEAERVKNQKFELGRGINGVVAQTREPMILDDYQASPYVVPECFDVVATISVPILFGDRLLGVLHSHTTTAGRRFTPDDLRRLQALATQAAYAIENARLHEATQKELADRIRAEEVLKQSEEHARRLARENATMAEIGRIISSSPNIQEVYQSFADEVQKLLAFDRIVINSINVEKNVVRNLYIAGEQLADRNVSDVYPLEGSGNAEMVRTKASLLLQPEDFREHQDRFPELASTFRAGFRSILNVPLLVRGQIVGGLLLRSREPNAYTQDDVRLAERIGAQIAGAVANTQLYLENARLYEAAARRGAELEAFLLSGNAMGSSLELDQVLEAIVQQASAMSAAPIVRLFLLEEDAQLLRCRVAVGFPLEEARELVIPVGTSLSGQVAVTGEPLAVADTRGDRRTHYPAHVAKYGVVSYLGLPVKHRDRLFGVLVFNTPAPRTYSRDEIAFLNAFAQQAALAIQNARLYETAVRRGAEREALLRATRSVMAGLDLQEILDRIVAEASHIASAPHVKVLLLDKAAKVLRVTAAKGTATPVGYEFPLGASLSGLVAQTGEPLFQADSPADPRNLFGQADRDLGIVTYLGLPIKKGGDMLGVLAINTTEPRRYAPEDLAYLAAFANQAAIAIENARLYEATQWELRVTQSLSALYPPLISPSSSLENMLQTIVEQAKSLTGSEHGYVSSIDPVTGDSVGHTLTEMLKEQCQVGTNAQRIVSPRGADGQYDALWGHALNTRQPFFTNDPASHPASEGAPAGHVPLRRFLSVPVLLGDELVGQIALANSPRDYTQRDLDAICRLGGFYALAIQRKRAEDAVGERTLQLEAVRDVSVEITQELNLQKVLHLVAQKACALTGAAAADIDLWEPDRRLLVPEASYGHTAPRPRTTRRPGEGAMGTVAQTRRGMIINDYRSSPVAHPDTLAHTRITASLIEPLLYHDRLLGVIGVDHETPGRTFTTQDRALLTLFASQAAIAIENARVHEAVQRHAAELEARVTARTAELQEALRVKAEFLARMSHELRTPLNFVLGFAELLQQGIGGALTPKQAQFVERIRSGGKHLLELVSDILDLSVVEAGKGGLQLEPLPVTPLVREVLDLFGIQAAQKRLALRHTVAPELAVVAEHRKLVQILSNLVGNAVKFTPEGGTITVTARRVPAVADVKGQIASLPTQGPSGQSAIANLQAEVVEIAVADTGIGLASGDLERIFRGFEQVDGSSTRRHGGAGIGLALVRTLVELHGGKIWAESAGAGHGARFVVHLPFLEATPPKRVLVVEDQAALLKTLCVFLRDAGYAVEGAATGTGALAAMQARAPDLLILDIGLPDMDGREILRRLHAEEPTRGLPVLVLTGLGEAQADQALALGASEFLTKPVSPSALIGIVRGLLTGGTRHAGPLAPDPEK